ncbi:aminopeptidase [Pterulicium gracile]|uniref:Peptide hydrolase n=1 Tax=Pterulicium gracile TaxID=1884261 RepID=A0A5C3QR08_9AGAR|nr:aminopeptidase [Pterula gracilis]
MKLSAAFVLVALLGLAQAVPVTVSEISEKSSQGLRLVQLAEDAQPVWKTEDEVLQFIREEVNFFDITDTWAQEQDLPQMKMAAIAYPTPSHQSAVSPLIVKLSTTNMSSWLSSLTAYNNRYYRASTGQAASVWIQNTLRSIATSAGRSDITITPFSHTFLQTSTIVRFPGAGSDNAITILGAHMDSINSSNPMNGRAPGADDNASGTVNLMDVFRVLAQGGFKPSSPLELHFYGGEEAGLLGSNDIAINYKSTGKAVKAVLNLDMSAYSRPGSTAVIGIMPDFTDASLSTFLTQVVTTYSKLPAVKNSPCGYACSDHASWYRQGFPASHSSEGQFPNGINGALHTISDTTSLSGFSVSHALEMSKVALGFAYELTV